MSEVRVTELGALVELQGESISHLSQLGALVEIAAQGVYLSELAVLVELGAVGVYVTQLGVLIELEPFTAEEAVPTYFPKSAGARALHTLLPEEVTGYAFDPQHSWWSIVVPEATENLVDDPSFERAANFLSGPSYFVSGIWTEAVITDTAVVGAVFGRRCVRLHQTAGVSADFEYKPELFLGVTPGLYTFSLYINPVTLGSQIELQVVENPGDILVRRRFTFTQPGWQRLHLTYAEAGTGNRILRLRTLDSNDGGSLIFYTDAWQFEKKGYPTTYTDGDRVGWNDIPPHRSYYWRGAPHASTSVRRATTGSGGREISFSTAFQFLTTGLIGLGMAPVSLQTLRLASGEELLTDITTDPRDFTITGRLYGENYQELNRKRNDLMALLRPNNTSTHEPLILRYQATDSRGRPMGIPLDIVCAYREGMGGAITNLYTESIPLQFRASQPYPMETIENSQNLTLSTTLTRNSLFYRDRTGLYQNLGTGTTTGTIETLDFTRAGEPLAGGLFSELGGSTVANLAKWTGSAWEEMDADFPLNGRVWVVDAGAQINASRIVVGGAFTLAGVNNMRRIGLYSESGGWFEPADGLNGEVLSLARHPNGDFWAGGNFDADGPGVVTGIEGFVRYIDETDSWEQVGTATFTVLGGGGENIVRALAYDGDNTLYVGGDFLGFEYPAETPEIANRVMQVSLDSGLWQVMDGGFDDVVRDLIIGPDGSLYAVGDFLTAGVAGYALRGFARWNGHSWEEMFPLNEYHTSATVRAKIDKDGIFWFWTDEPTDGFTIPGYGQCWFFGWKNGIFYPQPFKHEDPGGSGRGVTAAAFGYEGELLLAYFHAAGTMRVPALNEITYYGSADAKPTLVIGGICTPHFVENLSVQAGVYFRDGLQVSAREEMRLVLTDIGAHLFSTARPTLMRHVYLGGSDFQEMRLMPGLNRISLLCSEPDSPFAYLSWRNRYWGIEAAIS